MRSHHRLTRSDRESNESATPPADKVQHVNSRPEIDREHDVTTATLATSRQEELALLGEAEYMLRLSECASAAVLFFRRLARGVPSDAPAMRSLEGATRRLVSSLQVAERDASLNEQTMLVHQLTPAHVYRATISASEREDVHDLAARILSVLDRSDKGSATESDFRQIASTLDYYNRSLDQKAAQAIASTGR